MFKENALEFSIIGAISILIFWILSLAWHLNNQTQDCKLKGIEKGLSAIEIQGICK
jgi:hypothetical protein